MRPFTLPRLWLAVAWLVASGCGPGVSRKPVEAASRPPPGELSPTTAPGLESTGLLFGLDHAFYVSAPPGWVLDNEAGASQGVPMVFYPAGESWQHSPVIAYGRAVSRAEAPDAATQVERTLRQFHLSGSPDYAAERIGVTRTADDKEAVVYHFHGDRWGNFEAAAYVVEKATLNFIVLTARSRAAFDRSLPAFAALVASYRNGLTPNPDPASFDALVRDAEAMSKTAVGAAHEREVLSVLGPRLREVMRQCTAFAPEASLAGFDLVLHAGRSGTLEEVYVRPETKLTTCVRALSLATTFPPWSGGDFLEHVAVQIAP